MEQVYSVTLCKSTYVSLAVICHLHVWRNYLDLLHAIAVTLRERGEVGMDGGGGGGGDRYLNKSVLRRSEVLRSLRHYPQVQG